MEKEKIKAEVKKPPIGLTPKQFHDRKVNQDRYIEVRGAIHRYFNECLPIKIEWIEEYNELTKLITPKE